MSRLDALIRHPVCKEYRQLGMNHAPILPPACPLFRNVNHGQIQHFQQAVVRGEHRFGLGHLTKLAVEALNGIGGVDEPPHLLRILEVGAHTNIQSNGRMHPLTKSDRRNSLWIK